MSTIRITRGAVAGLVALALLSPLSATAQIEEILVTAKQREESLQDVPLSIAALNEEQLDSNRITDLRDLAQATPNLIFTSATGRETPSILAIRGIAPNTGSILLQGVSVFLDGVYVGGGVQSLDLTQLERVEVLRGPQSTTFGRQTYAGAINYITKTPRTDTLTGVAKADYSSFQGSEKDNWQLSGTVQFPLMQDRVWLELGGTKKVLGEMALTGSRGKPIGREETEAFNAALYIEPMDNLSIRLRAMIGEERDSTPLIATTHPQEWAAFGVPTTVRGGGLIWPNGELYAPPPSAADCESDIGRPVDCGVDRDREFFSAIVKYMLRDYELSYLGGWGNDDRWSNTDLYFRGRPDPFFGDAPYSRPGGPGGTLLPTKMVQFFEAQNQEYRNQSHELRFLSPGDQAFRWRAGLYYFSERESFFRVGARTETNPDGRGRGDGEVKNYAAFGGVAWDFTEQWGVEIEARLQKEDNYLGACLVCSAAATGAYKEERSKESDTDLLPRLTLTYRPTADMMLYGLFSQGTKAGRYNTTIREEFRYVDPEKLTNYEIGAKSGWLDGRLLVNGAVFFMKVDDQQFSTVAMLGDPPVAVTTFDNIGKSESIGFELDGQAAISDRWTAGAALGYAKHEYTSAIAPTDANLERLFDGETFKGKTSIGLPRWTGNAYTQYVVPLNAGMDVKLDANVTYQGKTYADQANLAEIEPITRVNLRSALDMTNWEVAVFVRDLFDNDSPSTAPISATNSCLYLEPEPGDPAYAATQRCLAVGIDRGREVGASVRFRF